MDPDPDPQHWFPFPEMFSGKTVPCCACFQVTTTTRTIKEVTYLGPDGQPIDYLPSHMPPMLHYDHNDYQNQVTELPRT